MISYLNMSYYQLFLISPSVVYRGTNKALSWNLVVISTTLLIICGISWNYLANCCTLIVGANSAWNRVTKSDQVMDSMVGTPRAWSTSSHQYQALSLRHPAPNLTFDPSEQKLVISIHLIYVIHRLVVMVSFAVKNFGSPHPLKS